MLLVSGGDSGRGFQDAFGLCLGCFLGGLWVGVLRAPFLCSTYGEAFLGVLASCLLCRWKCSSGTLVPWRICDGLGVIKWIRQVFRSYKWELLTHPPAFFAGPEKALQYMDGACPLKMSMRDAGSSFHGWIASMTTSASAAKGTFQFGSASVTEP